MNVTKKYARDIIWLYDIVNGLTKCVFFLFQKETPYNCHFGPKSPLKILNLSIYMVRASLSIFLILYCVSCAISA